MKKILFFILVSFIIFSFCGCSSQEDSLKIVTITDPHFTGSEYFLYEGTFASSNDSNGTGKQVKYNEFIFDAFSDQMLSEKPEYIIIAGDMAFDGAKVSHLAFAEKLRVLSEEGIKILVIPGNHDITSGAYIYPTGEPEISDSVTPEEFKEIYSDFGYTGAISYDENSLSYVYDTGENARIFMLDTNLMYGVTLGKLNDNTLSWLEEQLIACQEAGAVPIVVGHHSLLTHNSRFDINHKLGNGDEVAELVSEYGATLYICGHYHIQHYVQTESITDIINSSICIYPHRYGVVDFSGESWTYESKTTDVVGYAEKIGSTDENLLGYDDYGYNFFYNNAYNQAKGAISEIISDPEILEKCSVFSGGLNVAYFNGVFSDIDLSFADEFVSITDGTDWNTYIKTVLADTKDNIYCQWPAEETEE